MADVEGARVTRVATEAQLLRAWVDVLRRHDPDLLLGYNCWQFDWKYLAGRAFSDDPGADPFAGLGRQRGAGGRPRSSALSSAAYGDNSYFRLETPGVLQLDLLQQMKKDHKLDSYSLNAVSAKFLGDAKLDLPAGQLFAKFASGDPEQRAEIGRYCVKDTELPLRLVTRLNVFENLSEMANAVRCPVEDVIERGQQVRVWSLFLEAARRQGFVCPDDAGWKPEGKYEGATVLDARRGAYFAPVVALDFASLYPSIIRWVPPPPASPRPGRPRAPSTATAAPPPRPRPRHARARSTPPGSRPAPPRRTRGPAAPASPRRAARPRATFPGPPAEDSRRRAAPPRTAL